MTAKDSIQAQSVDNCPVCRNDESKLLYCRLSDRLYGAPGEWNFKECCNCGLVFMDPRPLEGEIWKAYSNYYTHAARYGRGRPSTVRRIYGKVKEGYLGTRWGYDVGVRKWQLTLAPLLYLHPGRRADLDFDVMYLEAVPGGRLLDVGCGSGELIGRLQGLSWQVKGIDFDEQAARAARGRGLEVDVGTLESRAYPDESFDAVTMSHLIEHVYNPLGLLQECHRILRPHGKLVVVTPNASSLGHRRFRESWRGLEPPRHLQVFTPSSLGRLAARADLQGARIRTTVRDAHGLLMASRSLERRGRHSADDPQPWTVRTGARIAQLLEWATLKARPNVGEEIVLVAEKR